MNTRRIIRRTAAVVLGLSLGWFAAAPAPASAAEPSHDAHGHASGGHHPTAADNLAVGPNDAPFYQNVLLAAVGLFVAAIALGAPAEKARGPLPPDPADTHGHDDHAHDDHGHAAHH